MLVVVGCGDASLLVRASAAGRDDATTSARTIRIRATVALPAPRSSDFTRRKLWRSACAPIGDACIRRLACALAALDPSARQRRILLASCRPGFAAAEIAKVVDAGLMAPSVESVPARGSAHRERAGDRRREPGRRDLGRRSRPARRRSRARRSARLTCRASPGRHADPSGGAERGAHAEAVARHGDGGSDARPADQPRAGERGSSSFSCRSPRLGPRPRTRSRVLGLTSEEVTMTRETASTFAFPYLTELQRAVLARALAFVGSPYVWAGTSRAPQKLSARCSRAASTAPGSSGACTSSSGTRALRR